MTVMDESNFLWGELPVNHSLSQDLEADWQMRVATWPSDSCNLLLSHGPAGCSGKMSPEFCHLEEDGTLVASSAGWQNSGMGSPTEFLTLNSSEWNHTLGPSLKDAGVCSLSDILETGDVPRRYFLSATACRGILRRAEKRGKELPAALRTALQNVAREAPMKPDAQAT